MSTNGFKKACEDPDGKYGKYFYIEDCPDGKLPCNWRSYFGGSVWEPLPGHPDKCYLHLFHKKQPDLNWENPELREEVYKMITGGSTKGLPASASMRSSTSRRHFRGRIIRQTAQTACAIRAKC